MGLGSVLASSRIKVSCCRFGFGWSWISSYFCITCCQMGDKSKVWRKAFVICLELTCNCLVFKDGVELLIDLVWQFSDLLAVVLIQFAGS